ncbi:spondin-1-like isoform X4 [Eriocheir sinensis]|uniref:spondin-1-like isoform X4 n=1 Tax=Eriocheir sinensis TaxID=95602 RepID=UPI0021C8F724|nr:spondin-1-like isoform X4 [Eriocheir sinensis]
MSHGPQYVLFHAGEPASPALKSFAETGRSDLIDQGAQAENGVLDAFNTPPITQGVGVVTAQFFVDGNHSRVSLVSKIVPSPDWFVGVDSFDLCEDGNWVDNVKIQVDPLDAGTDNGLTFTSPDWPTTPPERIFRITADYPSHPAHSFNYPTLKHLPRIATFTITKEKEYTLRKPMDVSDPASYNVVKQEDIAYKHYGDQVSIMSNSVEDEGRAGRGRGRAEDLEEEDEDEEEEEEEVTRVEGGGDKFGVSRGHHGPVAQNRIPPGNAMAVIDDIVKNYQKEQRKKRRKQRRKQRREERRRRKGLKKIRPPRDCRVSEWSGWSTCSKTCGIGEQTRARIIVKHARRGGKVCPVLEETTWCGSARACPNKIYFNWT